MKVSYEWLQSYFDEKLPSPEELAELLTFQSFEIEGVERVGADTVIDVDVLPNRSSDCLCHRGIARELATLLERTMKDDPLHRTTNSTPDSNLLEVDIQSPDLVNRFSAAVLSNIEVTESPAWLRRRLEALGQKSINNVVDATNYVMFDIGQPLHAFDRDKFNEKDGGYVIGVRAAQNGEKITTLTGEEYKLDERNLVIIDGGDNRPVGIAGVKGGKQPEVDQNTTNLIIEAANFNYSNVRKTSQQLKLWTDASIRFQNQPSEELTLHALREVVALIGGSLEGFVDYNPNPTKAKPVSVTVSAINDLLGTAISADEVEQIIKRLSFEYTRDNETFIVTPPFERTDINISEDVIEEVGRVYGYRHVESTPLPETDTALQVNKRFYYAEKIRGVLLGQGFSEVYTYALRDSGEVELANALAADRPYMRNTLTDGLRESVELNIRNADLLGLSQVRIFEIGTVFTKSGEYTALALAVRDAKKKQHEAEEVLQKVIAELSEALGTELAADAKDGMWEINLSELLERLADPQSYDDVDLSAYRHKDISFQPISQYPFMLRDLAVWVPKEVGEDQVRAVVAEHAGALLVRTTLFDVYEKDDRVSYAFRLVFLSHEKTLSDDEVNGVMEKVTTALSGKGWEVR